SAQRAGGSEFLTHVWQQHLPGPPVPGAPHAHAREVLPLPQPRREHGEGAGTPLGAGHHPGLLEAGHSQGAGRYPGIDPRAGVLPPALFRAGLFAAVNERIPDFADVVAAAARVGPHVVRTPVLRSTAFDARVGREVFFKCENLQTGGAFKYRGAMNVLLQLDAARTPLVITHSSGNHGNALALAARARGMQAIVIIPRDSARSKIAAIEAAGARIELCEPGLPARERRLAEILARESAELVHPFDDERIIAGQGTAALELLTEVPDLDVISTPVGGGGLIGGTALAARQLAPGIRVIGAEPEQADDAYRSFRSGQRCAVSAPQTIADGLRGSIGVRNFELLKSCVDDVVSVSEQAIVEAMRVVLGDLKLLIEPSSAVPMAALLAGNFGAGARRIGIVLSGGNVDLELCPFLRGHR